MKKIIVFIPIFLLLSLTFSPILATTDHNDEDDYVIEDRRWDVKIFGIFPNPAQFLFGSVDILSVSFEENSDQPDDLSVIMNVRDLSKLLPEFDSGYTVSWWMNNVVYCLVVHRLPSDQISQFVIGHSEEANDDIVEWNGCDGVFNTEQNYIKWTVSKENIGNPSMFSRLSSIYATTFVRKIYDSRSGADLFKDLTINAKYYSDYNVKY
jgi:hypothetical protein